MSAERDSLALATFEVAEVAASDHVRWMRGRLEIDPSGMARTLADGPGLRTASVHVVGPGEPVRLVNVLDAVEPVAKAPDANATFPGALGPSRQAGTGRTHRLEGVAVIATADIAASHPDAAAEMPDSLIDMAGPAAEMTPWGGTINLVASFECDPTVPFDRVDRSIRRATLGLARDVAATTLDASPDHVEELTRGEADPALPSVCAVVQLAAEGPGEDTYLYGEPAVDGMPRTIDPREVLDGAITAASYDWPGVRTPTFLYQRSELLLRLLRDHGRRVRLAGVVLTLGYLNGAEEKLRMAEGAAGLAGELAVDGAILTTFSSGNSHTDTMLTARACERAGIRTTVLIAETNGGLTDHVPEVDSIVSVGNEDELVPAWSPERVIGGEVLRTGRPAADAGPMPVVHYLGALSETGDLRLRAMPA